MIDSLRRLFEHSLDDCAAVMGRAEPDGALRTFMEFGSRDPISSFCCPTNCLKRVADLVSEGSTLGGLHLCAFGDDDRGEWADARLQDATWMNALQSEACEISSYSVAMPSFGPSEKFYDDLRGFASADIEVRISPTMPALEEAIAQASERDWISLAFPIRSVEEAEPVSNCITQCVGLELPFRLIALRGNLITRQREVGVLNALGASVLAFAEDLSGREVRQILEASDSESWTIENEHFRFGSHGVSTSQIAESRSIAIGVGVLDLVLALKEIAALAEKMTTRHG